MKSKILVSVFCWFLTVLTGCGDDHSGLQRPQQSPLVQQSPPSLLPGTTEVLPITPSVGPLTELSVVPPPSVVVTPTPIDTLPPSEPALVSSNEPATVPPSEPVPSGTDSSSINTDSELAKLDLTDGSFIKVDLAASFLADMTDIVGAYYDPTRNQLVFVGKKDTTIPEFDKDDLAVAIRSIIFNNAIPAVSIDFRDFNNPLSDPTMKVTHYGGIEDTNFGKVMLEADLRLKYQIHGYNEDGTKVTSSVPSYKSYLDRLLEFEVDLSKQSFFRLWISPKEITLKKDDAQNAFVFDKVIMQVQTQPNHDYNDSAWNKVFQDFSIEQTENYDQYAVEIPEYAKIKQLGKIISVVRWLKDNQIPTDYQWARDHTPLFVPTPREVNVVTSPNVCSVHWCQGITGGVQYDTTNKYIEDSNRQAETMQIASQLASSGSLDGVSWDFINNGQAYTAAVLNSDLHKSPGEILLEEIEKHPYESGVVIVAGSALACLRRCPPGFSAQIVTTAAALTAWIGNKAREVLLRFTGSSVQWFSTDILQKSLDRIMKIGNDLHHIFNNPGHLLEPLVKLYGGQRPFLEAVFKALNGKIPTGTEKFTEITIKIEGFTLKVSGVIHEGLIKLGDIWIPR